MVSTEGSFFGSFRPESGIGSARLALFGRVLFLALFAQSLVLGVQGLPCLGGVLASQAKQALHSEEQKIKKIIVGDNK